MSSITGTVTLNIEVRVNGFLIEGQKAAELAYKLLGPVPEGEDTGDEVSALENGPQVSDGLSWVPKYRYFHDGDIEGGRWYRKVESGKSECTGFQFKEDRPEQGWRETPWTYTLSELNSWIEVSYSELPEAAR